jgi:starch synthase
VRIVFIASEAVPYSKTGGLADVVGALPKALARLGHRVGVILPRYQMTKPGQPVPLLQSITIPLAAGFKFAAIQEGKEPGTPATYLVDCPDFFDRKGLYQENGQDYPDNAERFAAFSLAALELMKRSEVAPDVIHCHDWQAALALVYLRTLYAGDSFFRNTATLFTIHNLAYQGLFPPSILPRLGLSPDLFTMEKLEFYGKVNLLKGGIVFADSISTVSRKYAEEIQTAEYGCGLDGILRVRAAQLRGILNGIDYEDWNPATDKLIAVNFTPENLEGKKACKKALLEKMGAKSPALERPVIGIVSRFATQKGFDLIQSIAEKLMALDLYVVALGTGEPKYEELFRKLAAKYQEKFLVRVAYDNVLAHQIEAGADMFLMPSRFEPCGLNQIYSLKYGTVPVVRATGGLDDTIEPFDGKKGTGFKFKEYEPEALWSCLESALSQFRQPKTWQKLMQNGMKKDFSWTRSAREYTAIFEALVKAKSGAKSAGASSNA